jgi:hypothetical protein
MAPVESTPEAKLLVLDAMLAGWCITDYAQEKAELTSPDSSLRMPWPEGINPWTIAAEMRFAGWLDPMQRGEPVVYKLSRHGRTAVVELFPASEGKTGMPRVGAVATAYAVPAPCDVVTAPMEQATLF